VNSSWASPRSPDLDQHFSGLRAVEIERFNLNRLARFERYCRFTFIIADPILFAHGKENSVALAASGLHHCSSHGGRVAGASR